MGVDGRPGGGVDSFDGGGELLTGHGAPNRRPQRGQAAGWRVEQDLDGVAELPGGQVKCRQGPQPFPGAGPVGPVGPGQQGAQELVEQVEGVITRVGLQLPRRRQQGRGATLLAHPGNRLRPRGGHVPGEGLQPAGWDEAQVQVADAQRPDLLQAVQRSQQPGGGDAGRAAPQPLQRRGALAVRPPPAHAPADGWHDVALRT